MIIDTYNQFASATALNTGGAGSYLLGDVIDLGSDGLDLGAGDALYLVIKSETAATSGGSATGKFSLVSDAQAAIATDGSATVHVETGDIAVADMVAGYEALQVRLPAGTYERYLGILQTTAVAAFTGGTVDAFLTKDISAYKAYPGNTGAV